MWITLRCTECMSLSYARLWAGSSQCPCGGRQQLVGLSSDPPPGVPESSGAETAWVADEGLGVRSRSE
jgi:hypothetical protein